MYKNELFLINNSFIGIFSKKKKKFRFWHENKFDIFNIIKNFIIYDNIIYVNDAGHHKIFALSLDEDLNMEYAYDYSIKYSNIFCFDDYMYLINGNCDRIEIFDIISFSKEDLKK